MPLALNVIYAAALVIFAPLLVYRWLRAGKYREGWSEKLWGEAPWRIGDHPCLWFHAVSVGEVLLLRPLVDEMSRRRPRLGDRHLDHDLYRTRRGPANLSGPRHVLRPAGLQLGNTACRDSGPAHGAGTRRAGALAEPDPGGQAGRCQGGHHQCATQSQELPRLSTVARPLRSTLHRIDAVVAQDAEYARRFVELGVPEDRVSVTGSVKFDGLESDRNNARTRALRELLGLSPADLVFVAGSTMEGEEAAALAAYRAARRAASQPPVGRGPQAMPNGSMMWPDGWSLRASPCSGVVDYPRRHRAGPKPVAP